MGVQEGEKWQRRRPRWLAVTRVSADLLQRVAHCTYRPWASTEKPIVDLADLPESYKVMPHHFVYVSNPQVHASVVCLSPAYMYPERMGICTLGSNRRGTVVI